MGNAGLMAFYAGDFSLGQEYSIFSVSALTPKDWSKLTRHAGGAAMPFWTELRRVLHLVEQQTHWKMQRAVRYFAVF